MIRRLAAIGVVAASLAGCHPPSGDGRTLSLDEARQASSGIEVRAFEPPPRSLIDIERLLQENASVGAAERARLADAAAREPDRDLSDADLARFYFDRANAATVAGRAAQAREDLEAALAQFDRTGARELAGLERCDVLASLAAAHFMTGDVAAAYQAARDGYRASATPGARLASASLAASYAIRIGRLDEARALEDDALALEPQLDAAAFPAYLVPINRARLRLTDSMIAISEGNVAAAERLAREAQQQAESAKARSGRTPTFDMPTTATLLSATARATLAEQLARQGRHAEAELEARAALSEAVRRFGSDSVMAQAFLVHLAVTVLEQDRAADAARLAQHAIDAGERLQVSPETTWLNRARRTLGTALVMERRFAEAAAAFDRIESALTGSPALFAAGFQADIGWALALVASGQAAHAQRNIGAALAQRERLLGAGGPGVAMLRATLAVARRAAGDRAGALAAWRRQDTIGRIALATPRGAVEDMQRRLLLEDYLALVADLPAGAALDPAAESFRIAEALRGGAAQRALARASARKAAAGTDPQLADLAEREQQAERQALAAAELLTAMLAAGTTTPDPIAALRQQVVTLEAAQRALRAELSGRFPAYASLIEPQPLTPSMVQVALAEDEALVATYQLSDRLLVWGIPKRGPVAFARPRLGADRAEHAVAMLRRALAPTAETLGDIPAFDTDTAYQLYAAVLEPVAAAWRPVRHMITVPHGALASLPWQVLPSRPVTVAEQQPLFSGYRTVPWLARSHAVTALPSAGALALLRAVPPGNVERRAFVGFGNPAFGYGSAANGGRRGGTRLALRSGPGTQVLESARVANLSPLPETADELTGIAAAVGADPRTDLHLGAAASEGAVKRMSRSGQLSRYRVLSFATHGLVPGDLDGLAQPALALTNPTIARDGEDGLLTLDEILGLKLDADWAILSACNTAQAGSEAFAGLGRAFFHAGARALLVSNWPVHSEATRDLMVRIFDSRTVRMPETRAEALRRSMVNLIDEGIQRDDGGRALFAYAHPLFWAPFTLLGDGSGR